MKLIVEKISEMKKSVVYILFFIGFIGFSQETPIAISSDTTTIRIGEQIQYKIAVQETTNVIFPELQLDSLGKVEVVEALPVDTIKDRLEKKYLLTSFDSGQYVIPQQQVIINGKKFLTDSLLINVATVKVDTTKQKMFLIKSIKREPKTFDDYKHLWWWIIPVFLLIGLILYFILRKKKEKAIAKIYVAPIKEALQRLKELDEKELVKQNKIKIYYSELTDIVRTYIEKDIKIPALESTTNELIETIYDFNESSKLGISKETIKQLKKVLESADLVKFAKSKPIVEEIRGDRNSIEEILKNTQTAVHQKEIEEGKGEIENEIFVAKPVKKKNTFKKYLFVFLALIVLALGTVGYFGYKFVKNTILGSTSSEMMDKDWYTSSYGYPEITLETPEILKAQSMQLPTNGMSSIGDFSSYNYGSLISNFYVEVSTIHFLSELENFDIDGGVQGTLKQLETMVGSALTTVRQKEIELNGIEGREITANYTTKNQLTQKPAEYQLTILLIANTKAMQQVMVSCLNSDVSAKEVSKRIINSVSINR